jgi:hypothetical protein
MAVRQPRQRSGPGRRNGGREQQAPRQEYLAAELGHTLDSEGEPIGLGNPLARQDSELQEFTHQLWRQAQTGRELRNQLKDMEQEGLTPDDLWAAGITELLPTTSTPDEVRRYRQKLLFRANFLEAVLTETIAELKRLGRVRPVEPDQKTD